MIWGKHQLKEINSNLYLVPFTTSKFLPWPKPSPSLSYSSAVASQPVSLLPLLHTFFCCHYCTEMLKPQSDQGASCQTLQWDLTLSKSLKSTTWSAHSAFSLMPALNLAAVLAACSLQPRWLPAVPGPRMSELRACELAPHRPWNAFPGHLQGICLAHSLPAFGWITPARAGFSLSQMATPPGHFLSPLCFVMIFPELFVIIQHSA